MDLPWLETILKKNEWENEIASIIEIKSETALPKGENYTSTILRTTMKLLLRSGQRVTRKAIVKQAIPEKLDFLSSEFTMFKTEVKVYCQVLSLMEDLMEEFGENNEKMWCQLIGYNPYDLIVFQDLCEMNYMVSKRANCLDLDYALLVMDSIGRFHAMSKVLLERGLIAKEDFGKHFVTSDSELTLNLTKGGLTAFSETVHETWPPEWKEFGNKLAAGTNTAPQRLKNLLQVSDDNFNVLNHGDLWTCNMMFKHSDYCKSPISVKFVDFQFCLYNTYMLDIIYFLYSSVIPSVRRANIDRLYETYHRSLSKSLEFYSFEGNVPTLDEIKSEAKRLDFWAFFVTAVTHPLTSADTTEAFDIEKMNPKENAAVHAFNKDVWKSKYFESTKDDFQAFMDNGTI